jgi:HK97 gp10 family phage protein
MLGLDLKGLDMLEKALEIREKSTMAALKPAVKAGGRIILKATKDECPVSVDGNFNHPSGNLKKSEKMKLLKPKKPGQLTALIGETVGKKAKNDGWYSRLVELGTSKTKPNGYKRRAFDNNINRAKAEMARVFKEGLEGKTVRDISDIADMILDEAGGD